MISRYIQYCDQNAAYNNTTCYFQPMDSSPSNQASKPGLVASYGGDSDEEEDEDQSAVFDESKLIDWDKLTCLLCKRMFKDRDTLNKHTQLSNLHMVIKHQSAL